MNQISLDLAHSQNMLQAAHRERDHARQETGACGERLENAEARIVTLTPTQTFLQECEIS